MPQHCTVDALAGFVEALPNRIQTSQDIACCKKKFPDPVCHTVSAQFMSNDRIALFEFTVQDGEVKVVEEKPYRLVPAAEIKSEDLQAYNLRAD